MKKLIKNNTYILVAFLLPILFIIIITFIVYIPSIFISSDYKLLYAVCSNETDNGCNNYLDNKYLVENNYLVTKYVDSSIDSNRDGTNDIYENYQINFFVFDTKTNTNTQITYEESLKFKLDDSLMSLDGVKLSTDTNSSIILSQIYGMESSYENYLEKGIYRRKINIIQKESPRIPKYKFIGWVLNNNE